MFPNQMKNLLIDMDGVLWRGNQPMPGLIDFFASLRARQMGFMLLTNNSTRTIADYVKKLGGFGVEVDTGQVLTSSYATADWLTEQVPPGAHVYMVGEDGLHTALTEAGFKVFRGKNAPDTADVVAAGLSLGLNYLTIHHASRLVRDEGALFVGTNPDITFPMPGGLGPGAGTVLAAIAAPAGKQPIIIGKPNKLMYEQALKHLKTKSEETAMVGDQLETDILGGQRAGLKTILVLTGITRPEDLDKNEVKPTWVFDSIVELTAALNSDGR